MSEPATPFNLRPRAESVASEQGFQPASVGRRADQGYGSTGPTGLGGAGGGGGGIYREAIGGEGKIGRGAVGPDTRKFHYDILQGMTGRLAYQVGKDDRMTAAEAGKTLHEIHGMCGIATESPEFLHAFDQALFFFHTINGGSVLNPGRAKFSVTGSEQFSYTEIRDKLGVDVRRFFRGFADEIREANKAVLRAYDPTNFVAMEHFNWLMEVATSRGLFRYPDLAHDSADACQLNVAERIAVDASKKQVLEATVNSADRAKGNSRVISADTYDSTTGTHVPVGGVGR